MARPPRARRRDSHGAIVAAARLEFARHGYAGAGVDRIARRARVNKAMIYYHFGSKLRLYRHVLGEGVRTLITAATAATAEPPRAIDKFDAYVATLLHTASRESYLVPMMLREIAAGGRNLDAAMLRLLSGLAQVVGGILTQGRARGEFRDSDPVLTHLMIMGAAMLYVANAPVRARLRRMRLPAPLTVPVGTDPFARHLGEVLRRTFCIDQHEGRRDD